jgi:hypothetical protein
MNKTTPHRTNWKLITIVVLIATLIATNLLWTFKTADLLNYTVEKTQSNSGAINTLRDCYERGIKPCPVSQ